MAKAIWVRIAATIIRPENIRLKVTTKLCASRFSHTQSGDLTPINGTVEK
jgi:hypothetical protein